MKILFDVCHDGCEGRPWDAVILNGDTLDFASLARFDKRAGGILTRGHSNDELTLEEEIEHAKTSVFTPLRKSVGKKTQIIFRLGNHEHRYRSVSETKPEALMELMRAMRKQQSFYLPDLLELSRWQIDYDEREAMNLYGCYTITHGWKTNKTCANDYLHRLGSGTSGHTHKASVAQKILKGRMEFWHESGCLCRIKSVSYLPYGSQPDWIHGFLTVVIDTRAKRPYPQFHAIDDAYTCRFNNCVYSA